MQENLEGKTIGTLAIIKAVGKRKGSYLCKCLICGREFMDYRSRILAKVTPSCGCSAKAIMSVAAKEGKEEAYAGRLKSKKLFRNNTSGVKGVAWDKSRQKWIVKICLDYKQINLGRYDRLDDAIKARKKAEEKYFSERIKQIDKKVG